MQVVEDWSSQLGGPGRERLKPMKASHVDICRFVDKIDPKYLQVGVQIQKFIDERVVRICLLVHCATPMPLGLTDAQLVFLGQVGKSPAPQARPPYWPCSIAILASLRPPVISSAHVSDPHDQICSWNIQHDGYQHWLKQRRGFF